MSVAELRRTLARLAEIPEPALKAACKEVEEIARAEGGSVVLGRKRRKVKLKAITRIKGSGNRVTATVWGVPTGPWVWKNTGADAHLIPRKPPTPKRPRPMQGRGYAHPVSHRQVQHPGRGGDGAWNRVVKRANKVVPEIIEREIKKVIRG